DDPQQAIRVHAAGQARTGDRYGARPPPGRGGQLWHSVSDTRGGRGGARSSTAPDGAAPPRREWATRRTQSVQLGSRWRRADPSAGAFGDGVTRGRALLVKCEVAERLNPMPSSP